VARGDVALDERAKQTLRFAANRQEQQGRDVNAALDLLLTLNVWAQCGRACPTV
jgi:hypothetical protein